MAGSASALYTSRRLLACPSSNIAVGNVSLRSPRDVAMSWRHDIYGTIFPLSGQTPPGGGLAVMPFDGTLGMIPIMCLKVMHLSTWCYGLLSTERDNIPEHLPHPPHPQIVVFPRKLVLAEFILVAGLK